MPAYHSKKNEDGYAETCSCAVCPLKTDLKGPAPPFTPAAGSEEGGDDIIDETLNYFRANVLFRNFEVSMYTHTEQLGSLYVHPQISKIILSSLQYIHIFLHLILLFIFAHIFFDFKFITIDKRRS